MLEFSGAMLPAPSPYHRTISVQLHVTSVWNPWTRLWSIFLLHAAVSRCGHYLMVVADDRALQLYCRWWRDVIWQELRTNFEARRPQKAQLSSTANELLASRLNDVKLRERMERIDADWAHVESSLDACEQQLSAVQTLLLPSMQASRELTLWMDGVEQTVKAESSLQPKNADDVEQLHKKFTVWHEYLSCCHSLLHPFNGLFSRTAWISWHQKGRPFWILLEQEMMGWQWHQLAHMQIICTLLQTDNHASTSPLSFYKPDALFAAQPTASKHWRQHSGHKHSRNCTLWQMGK